MLYLHICGKKIETNDTFSRLLACENIHRKISTLIIFKEIEKLFNFAKLLLIMLIFF